MLPGSGDILIAGLGQTSPPHDGVLARFTSAGSLDLSFGTAKGYSVVWPSSVASVTGLAVQSDGGILALGTGVDNSLNTVIQLARLNSSGSPDTSFGGGQTGDVKAAISSGSIPDVSDLYEGCFDQSLSVQPPATPDDQIGNWLWLFSCLGGGAEYFSSISSTHSNDTAAGLTLQPDGKIVVLGSALVGQQKNGFALIRYTSSGTADTQFGSKGAALTAVLNDPSIPCSTSAAAGAVGLQADGRIVVAGTVCDTFTVVRYLSNGPLDPAFGLNGIVQTVLTQTSGGPEIGQPNAVNVQSDGKIVVAGWASLDSISNYAVARYVASNNSCAVVSSPGITSLSPSAPTAAATIQTVTVNGTGFQSGLTATINLSGYGSVNGAQVQNVTATSFELSAPLDYGAGYSLQVTNPDGGQSTPFAFTVQPATPVKGVITSPTPGSTLAGSNVTFQWSAANGASAYVLDLGTSAGAADIFNRNVGTSLTQGVSGIPVSGNTVYVRLWTYSNSVAAWVYNDYTYTAAAAATSTATSISASPSSANPLPVGSTVTFTARVSPKPHGGTVTFWDNYSTITGCGTSVLNSGQATCMASFSAAGTHSIYAVYSGDSSYGSSTSPTLSQAVNATLAIGTPTLPTAQFGTAYSSTIGITGGTQPYRFSWTGSLPPGLYFYSPPTLSGTPQQGGVYSISIKVTDASNPVQTVTGAVSITIQPTGALAITTSSLANPQLAVAYSASLQATGGCPPYTWSASQLPSGLTLDPNAGTLSGTPSATGIFTFTITVIDTCSGLVSKSYSFSISNPPAAGSGSLTPLLTAGGSPLAAISCVGSGAQASCWAVGSAGGNSPVILHSTDAGQTWLPETPPSGVGALYSISCPATNFCYASANTRGSEVIVTQDGTNWTALTTPTPAPGAGSISCPTTSTCYLTGGNSLGSSQRMMYTTNGGTSWTVLYTCADCGQPTVTGNNYVFDGSGGIYCPTDQICYAAGSSYSSSGGFVVGGAVLATTNGGASWNVTTLSGTTQLLGITCTGPTQCWVVGVPDTGQSNRPYVASTADGATWQVQRATAGTDDISNLWGSVACVSASACLVTGWIGAESEGTTDGGAHWITYSPPAGSGALAGTACVSSGECWLVTQSGGIFGTLLVPPANCGTATISTQPANQTITNGQTPSPLTVAVSGTTPFSYQWYQGNSGDTSTKVGTSSASYAPSALTATTSFWVQVTSACGSNTNSSTATVSVDTISAPSSLVGPTSGTVGLSYSYSTGGAISNLGHSVQYYFDWGDGSNSGWLNAGVTGASHTWVSAGSYTVTTIARDATNTSVQSPSSAGLTVTVPPMYLVGDTYPYTADTAGNFGQGFLDTLSLITTLRAVTNLPGFLPATCSDRFDAMDSYPVDGSSDPTILAGRPGGDGILNTLDLIETLRRVTNIDTSRPTRVPRGIPCANPVASPQSRRPAATPAEASLEFGTPVQNTSGGWRMPILLRANVDLALQGLSFSAGYESVASSTQLNFVAAGPQPSIVDRVPAKIAIAWLEGWQARAGQVVLGYLETSIPSDLLHLYGVSANAVNGGREVSISLPQQYRSPQ